MTNCPNNIDLEKLKQAINVEIKYQYIDIMGTKCSFSKFIEGELKKIYSQDKKNESLQVLIECFKHYATENMPFRKKLIGKLINTLKETSLDKKKTNNKINEGNKKNIIKSPENSDVIYTKGVGPKIGYILNKMGIFTALDLLQHYPKKYIDYSKQTLIKNIKEGESVTIFAYIHSVNAFNSVKNKKLSIITLNLQDSSGKLSISFFYAKANRTMLERYKSQFPMNSAIVVSGIAKKDKYTHKMTLDKPQFQMLNGTFDKNDNLNLGRVVPVYSVSENLNIKTLRTAIFNAIQQFKPQIKNNLPIEVIKEYNLFEKKDAIEQIHFPSNLEMMEKARFTLVFEELFILQLKLILFREQNNKELKTINISIKENGLVNQFIKNLPFELTGAQKRAIDEILKDLNSDKPMQRLLQGDVGSGKTVVATIMLLSAIENGYQAAIMAPTEILAQQHYINMIKWLTPLGLSVGLFVGTNSKKIRNDLETNLRNGQINIAVGTHALIQDNIEFNNLGAIVIDEQHRFGVKQRSKLRQKGPAPQILSMSATPIPRTLALTLHGDMDVTCVDELPKGRLPIKTTLIKTSQKKEMYKLIDDEIQKGHQAYIVYPLIEESETISAKAATIEKEKLEKNIFPQYKIGLLHGKLSATEKDSVMNDFKKQKYDILVSTTVVEVGVDVPNATIIVIENAERFGLSQLHQLRGRTGRSSLQSYCVLVSSSNNEETLERLKIMTQTNDGFIIAEKDLELRGPGDFLGTKQSGLPDLLITDLTRDLAILELARKAAIKYFHNLDKDEIEKLLNTINEQTTNIVCMD